MPKIKSFLMAKNTSFTGSVQKICAFGPFASSSIDRITFGTVEYSGSKEGSPGPGNLTSSGIPVVYTNPAGIGIPVGTCLDGAGIASFHLDNEDQNTIVYAYIGNEMTDGPN